MPRLSVNTKSQEAKARKAAVAEEVARKEQQRLENEYWKDDDKHVNAKINRRTEAQQKNEEKASRKAETKKLLEAEEAMLTKKSKNSNGPEKVTRAEIARRALASASAKQSSSSALKQPSPSSSSSSTPSERRGDESHTLLNLSGDTLGLIDNSIFGLNSANAGVAERKNDSTGRNGCAERLGTKTIDDMPLEENPNHLLKKQLKEEGVDEFVIATNLDDAVAALTIGVGGVSDSADVDRHPEKRRKAAFKAYEEDMMPRLKTEYPTLKRSQLQDMIFKQWRKAPENPMNQV